MADDESFCLFHCEGQAFAVAVASVAEIAEVDALVRISLCPPQIAGLCPYHRQVVPVVSFAHAIAQETVPDAEIRPAAGPSRVVVLILDTNQGLWGIMIDRKGVSISSRRPERTEPRERSDGVVTAGHIEHQGVVYSLLDAEHTWHGLRNAVAGWYAFLNESTAARRVGAQVAL